MAIITEAGEWSLLNERQQSQAESLSELALEYGKFDQSSGANGAHYAPAKLNPFKADGLVCRNCIFFDERSDGCQIVSGVIEPEAICKLWIIPEGETANPAQLTRDDLTGMNPEEIMTAKAQGRLDTVLGIN